jgi:hypothetical protein
MIARLSLSQSVAVPSHNPPSRVGGQRNMPVLGLAVSLSARLGSWRYAEARAPRGCFSRARRGVALRTHTSLFRQVEDVRAPVNPDECSAYRIPLHLTDSLCAGEEQHRDSSRCAKSKEARAE